MDINYYAIGACAVASMILGSVWYGPLFGKKWAEIIGATADDLEKRKEMQKRAMPLYIVQFVLVLFQALVLAHLIRDAQSATGMERSLWIWAAFIVPTIAGSSMWNNDSAKVSWARFLIQSGYQLVLFVVFGLILSGWR